MEGGGGSRCCRRSARCAPTGGRRWRPSASRSRSALGARLFGKWLRPPQATGTRFYEQPGFDDYFNWCTSDNPDLGTAPEWYRSDKAAVLCAVEKDGMQLRYASAELRDDEQVVRLTLIQNKAALGYASRKIKEKMHLELFIQKHALLEEARSAASTPTSSS